MAEFAKLKDILSNQNVYGDFSRRRVLYIPDQLSAILNDEMTGIGESQIICTEMNHNWIPFLFEGALHIVAIEPTMFALSLSGKQGYKNGSSCQERIAMIHENKLLGTKGVVLNRKIYPSLPMIIQDMPGKYWTADKNDSAAFFGYDIIVNGRKEKANLYDHYYFGGAQERGRIQTAKLILIQKLPEDILVDLDVSEGEPLSLFTSQGLQCKYLVRQEEMVELTNLAKAIGAKDILSILDRIKSRA